MELFKDIKILKIVSKNISKSKDIVINEKLFSIRVNKEEIVSLYCLPVYLKELSLGILFQEKIVKHMNSISSIKINDSIGVIDISLKESLTNTYKLNALKKSRFLTPDCANPSSFASISDEILCEPIETKFTISMDNLHNLLKQFEMRSELYRMTGGTHGAALCSNLNVLFYNEDISRHNCVDKLIGWSFLKDIKLSNKILITTGRITATMAIKAIKVSIPILVSRSAATWEAVRIAEKYNLSLAGFARGSRLNIYTYGQRFSI